MLKVYRWGIKRTFLELAFMITAITAMHLVRIHGQLANVDVFLYMEIAVILLCLVFLPMRLAWKLTLSESGLKLRAFPKSGSELGWNQIGAMRTVHDHRGNFWGYRLVPSAADTRSIFIPYQIGKVADLIGEVKTRVPGIVIDNEIYSLLGIDTAVSDQD